MKKLLSLSLLVLLLSVVAGAQQPLRYRHQPGEITRAEKLQLRKNATRYRMADHRAVRDGRISPVERRRLHHMKTCNRRELYRYRHNGRKRII